MAGVTEPDMIGIAEIVFASAFFRVETMVVGSEVEAKYNSFGTWWRGIKWSKGARG